ncbi:ATP-binding protein [Megamonas funiformis]|uniref:AAA family ATPase n=1 Tax=Megamonas funiformis TaxID=437897 RepID=UPI0014307393|nr:AAA family ATPase [Megamonas funiformis]MBM6725682.1 ATP-binding protein [Megamonas funiformis]NJE28094.1 ATP-binding protein [Megamonas funiformis]
MLLKIENLGMIDRANIEVNGITIIAGDNNTGKSTIGKALFAIFNALCNSEEKIKDLRGQELNENIQHICMDYFDKEEYINIGLSLGMQLSNQIMYNKNVNIEDEIKSIINHYQVEISEESLSDLQIKIKNSVDKIMNVSETDLQKEFLQRYFLEVFNEQINSLFNVNSTMDIVLTIKNRDIKIKFCNDRCIELEVPYKILHEAFYIDDPFIIDSLNINSLSMPFYIGKNISVGQEHLINSIKKYKYNRLKNKNIFASLFAEKSLEEIFAILNDVVEGNILFQDNNISLQSKKFNKPININNLSTGLKAFVILKILLERNILKEKDVLILDEPEIHLHPKWQMQYAQIIVLLQKFFDLSIIVTTHSADFLAAIEYYAKKHKNIDKCKFYLAKNEDNFNTFVDVTKETEEIYKQMFIPKFHLDELNYELEENEDE